METCIYKGLVTHQRYKKIKHNFSYKTFSILFDLSELEELHKNIDIFSFNKFNIFSFYNKDHGDRDGGNLLNWVKSQLKNYNLNYNVSKVKLLCFPRIFGYVFNPLSIFYCYEQSKLKTIMYEVKNTFNEQHTYIFSVSDKSEIITQHCDKKFYVSPFIEMETDYYFRLTEPKKQLRVVIKLTDKKDKILIASQCGVKREMSTKQLIINFFTYPLMTFKIISVIHFEALRLWKKGAMFQKRKIKVKNNVSLEQ